VPLRDEPAIRYREVRHGALEFKGQVTQQAVDLRRIGGSGLLYGTFAFRAIDSRSIGEVDPPSRVISFGSLAPASELSPEALARLEPPPRPSEATEPGDRPDSTSPRQDRRGRVNVDVVVVTDSTGCDGPSEPPEDDGCGGGPDSADGSGCGGGSGGGGCEGDSVDAGGCEGSDAASGCEGDSLDAGGCDGCSATGRSLRPRTLRSMWRFAWPLAWVAWSNRRWRRRTRSSTRRPREQRWFH
jgi:hypothetical protein